MCRPFLRAIYKILFHNDTKTLFWYHQTSFSPLVQEHVINDPQIVWNKMFKCLTHGKEISQKRSSTTQTHSLLCNFILLRFNIMDQLILHPNQLRGKIWPTSRNQALNKTLKRRTELETRRPGLLKSGLDYSRKSRDWCGKKSVLTHLCHFQRHQQLDTNSSIKK